MIDNKKIEEAARHNADKYRNYPTLSDEDRDKVSIGSFMDCAKWMQEEFLKDLWHSASEEPDVRHKTIICLYKDGDIRKDYDAYDEATEGDKLGRDEFNWDYYAEENEIKKWCYNTDLLPKEGGEK